MPEINYIEKKVILEILEKNRKLHKSIYEKSLKAFKKRYMGNLEEMKNKAKKNDFIFHVEATKPENHDEDYKNAIQIIKLSPRDEVQLSETESYRYILNKWRWKESFRSCFIANSSYHPQCISSEESSYLND